LAFLSETRAHFNCNFSYGQLIFKFAGGTVRPGGAGEERHCYLIGNAECTTGQYSHCSLSTHLQLFCGLSEDMHILHRILRSLFACCFQTCKRRAPTPVTAAPGSPPHHLTGLAGTSYRDFSLPEPHSTEIKWAAFFDVKEFARTWCYSYQPLRFSRAKHERTGKLQLFAKLQSVTVLLSHFLIMLNSPIYYALETKKQENALIIICIHFRIYEYKYIKKI
jgi:hypothetical protein